MKTVPGYSYTRYTPVFFISCSLLALLFSATGASAESASQPRQALCFGPSCVTAEIADSPLERMRGLMHRQGLEDGEAMLFIFEDAQRHGFWMKNMRFPIDIIWLDGQKRIVALRPQCQPCVAEHCPVMEPDEAALYVVELPAGFAAAHAIRIGQTVSFESLPHAAPEKAKAD